MRRKQGQRGSWDKGEIIRSLLRPYLLILLIPLLMSILVHHILFEALKSNAIRNNEIMIGHLIEKVDGQLGDIRRSALALSVNAQLKQHLTADTRKRKEDDVVPIKELMAQVSTVNIGGISEAMHLYCNNFDALVTAETAYIRLPYMVGRLVGRKDMDYGTWKLTYCNSICFATLFPVEENLVNGVLARRLIFAQSILDYLNG